MPPREELPDWLSHALAADAHPSLAFPEEGEWLAAPQPGEIRAARPMDEDAELPARLVLVLAAEAEDDPWVSAALLAESTDVTTDKDLRLAPADTGLSFPVLVETDIVGPLFVVQLGPILGRVDTETTEQIRSETVGRRSDLFAGRRGLPVVSRADARWRWKDRELAIMHSLSLPCMEAELGGRRPLTLVDPSLTDEQVADTPTTGRVETLLHVVGIHEEAPGTVAVVPEGIWAEEGHLEAWVASLPPDAWRALEPALVAALSGGSAQAGHRETTWEPDWPSTGTDRLAREIARRAVAGTRAVRVVTGRAVASRVERGGAIALRVGGIGLVQVKFEELEEEAA